MVLFRACVKSGTARACLKRLTTGVLWSARPPARRILVFKLLGCALPRAHTHTESMLCMACVFLASLYPVCRHTPACWGYRCGCRVVARACGEGECGPCVSLQRSVSGQDHAAATCCFGLHGIVCVYCLCPCIQSVIPPAQQHAGCGGGAEGCGFATARVVCVRVVMVWAEARGPVCGLRH